MSEPDSTHTGWFLQNMTWTKKRDLNNPSWWRKCSSILNGTTTVFPVGELSFWSLFSRIRNYGENTSFANINWNCRRKSWRLKALQSLTKWINGFVLLCRNDIALLKLEKSAVVNDKVQPACLPQHGASPSHNQLCYITGWGRLYCKSSCNVKQAIILRCIKYYSSSS